MDNLFQSKWFVLLISLAFAITLYFFVTTESKNSSDVNRMPGFSTEVQTLDELPLNVRMDTDNYVVSGVPDVVKASFEGKTSALTQLLGNNNYDFFIDLTGLEEGEHTVDVEYENISKDLSVYVEPKTIDVVLEKKATEEFTVEVDFVNMDQLPVDYEIGDVELSTDTITVVSSESNIEKIAMVKAYIDVKDLRESIKNREVPVSVSDSQGNALNVRIEPENVLVSVDVHRPSKKVPLEVITEGELEEGLVLENIEAPEEVDVFGRTNVLDEIETIKTKPIQFSDVTEDGDLEVELDLPDNVRMNDDKVTVTIELSKEENFTIPIDTAGDNEHNIDLADEAIDIVVTGKLAVMKDIKEDQFSATVNVADLDPGNHTVDIEVEGPDDLTIQLDKNNTSIEVTEQ